MWTDCWEPSRNDRDWPGVGYQVSVGILFPGQGSQYVGMGADVFDSRPNLLGDRADDILGFSLRSLCLDGPEEELTRTEHAQPAIFALSFALWDVLAGEGEAQPAGAAGHSLGEYTALTAAGVFDFDTALSLVSLRGRAMADAADLERSGMAALLGAGREMAEEISKSRRASGGRLQVANVNAPGQVVVAGGEDDVAWLVENARELGVRRAVPLNVAGAFHSDFMVPAQARVAEALESAVIGSPSFPVWANTTARPHQPGSIGLLLARQVVEPVLFADSLVDMAANGIDTFVHVGPGDVTAGLARRTVEGSGVHTISNVEDIRSVLGAVGTMGRP
jgi:[acyl-carrier-protein] S-malonyltransferase